MQAIEVTQDAFVTAHASGASVVDVRSPEEYAGGHVPGAVNIPLEQVESRRDEFTFDSPTHVICQSGGRSIKASESLAARGVQALSVGGGTKAWIDAGRPVVTGPAPR